LVHTEDGHALGAAREPLVLAKSLWCLRPDHPGKGAEMQHDEPHATMVGTHASVTHAGTPVARTLAGSALITCDPVLPASRCEPVVLA
jgi:hypothetical protein